MWICENGHEHEGEPPEDEHFEFPVSRLLSLVVPLYLMCRQLLLAEVRRRVAEQVYEDATAEQSEIIRSVFLPLAFATSQPIPEPAPAPEHQEADRAA